MLSTCNIRCVTELSELNFPDLRIRVVPLRIFPPASPTLRQGLPRPTCYSPAPPSPEGDPDPFGILYQAPGSLWQGSKAPLDQSCPPPDRWVRAGSSTAATGSPDADLLLTALVTGVGDFSQPSGLEQATVGSVAGWIVPLRLCPPAGSQIQLQGVAGCLS